MNDNTEYWKELFGDDDNEELMKMLNNPSPSDKPESRTDDADEGSRFLSYEIKPANNPPVSKAGASRAALDKDDEPYDKSEDFNVNFDFDGEYRDVPDDRPVRPRREKRTGCLGGILYAVFIICVCLLLASLAWLAATDVLGFGNEDELVQVTVPEDFSIDTIADILYEKGLIKYKFLFKLYADFSDAIEDKKITPGTFELNKNYDYRALIHGMNIRGGKRVETDVAIPEGFTLRQIIELLAANSVCTEEELWDAVANYDFEYDFLDSSTLGDDHRLEGFLFPDTYTFWVGDSPTRVIIKMLDNFKAKFKTDYIARAAELGYSVRDIVTIAAMIEKEAGADSDRDLIASVIYNRLNSKSLKKLQIDATIYYVVAETGQEFSLEIDSPYNTYMVEGLPAGPIANPGIASIRAALYPQSTKYYYYALNKDHTHNFFKDFDSQQAFVHSDEYGG
jgi:UPF0755 protein